MKKINNYINKIKLIITTNCNMKCSYCMVKNTKEYMSFDIAIKAIEYYILNTPNNNQKKFIYFFGGEPLLNFNLINDIFFYINKKYKNLNKLEFVICSNFTCVNNNILDFIVKNNIKLSISIGGKEKQHNSHRIFTKSQFNALQLTLGNIHNLKRKSKNLYNIGVGFVIIKKNVKDIFNNFIYIVEEIGLLHINFEIILEKEEWQLEDFIIFKKEYYKIIRYIFKNISKGKYIYLNNLNWKILLLLGVIDNKEIITQYLTEIYPNGDILYSSFFSNLEASSNVIVGNIKSGKFNDKIVLENYFNQFKLLDNFNGGEGYDSLISFLKKMDNIFGELIINKSKSNNNYLIYLSIIENIYF